MNALAPTPSRRRIVVGVDGSPASIEALRLAARIAPAFRAELDAVIAWHYPVNNAMTPILAEFDPAADATAIINSAVDQAFGAGTPAGLRRQRQEGHPARVLLDAAAGAELLVVGSRGHGGFVGLLLGSVSAHCVEHAACPVLVVHGSALDRPAPEPRQAVHNSNIDEESAAAGECGTLDLANGSICRRPALHPDGCAFEAPGPPPAPLT